MPPSILILGAPGDSTNAIYRALAARLVVDAGSIMLARPMRMYAPSGVWSEGKGRCSNEKRPNGTATAMPQQRPAAAGLRLSELPHGSAGG